MERWRSCRRLASPKDGWPMPRSKVNWSGWQGVGLVAITYVYFLIFAQFAFLQRLKNLGLAAEHLRTVMAAMAIGGILFSLVTPRLKLWRYRTSGFALDLAHLALLHFSHYYRLVIRRHWLW